MAALDVIFHATGKRALNLGEIISSRVLHANLYGQRSAQAPFDDALMSLSRTTPLDSPNTHL